MEEKPNGLFTLPATQGQGALVDIESARAIQEVQAAMVIAKRFRRDQNEAHTRIMKACERYSLADKATYLYPRGDTTVKGASIRLAEVIAQNWGNVAFGIKELSQTTGRSEAEAFAWDMETNTKQTKTFQVPHVRYSKKKGNESLKDPRDIYEHVANMGARRMRACILGIVPGDIVEDALAQCEKTVREGNKKKPLQDRIRFMLKSFSDIGVNQDMIETRLGHKVDTINEDELIEINNIGRSLADNMSGREEWFDLGASKLNEKLKPTKPKPDTGRAGEDPYKTNGGPEEEEKEETGGDSAIRKLYLGENLKGLTKLKFNKFMKGHMTAIPGMAQIYQDEIRAEYQRHFPGQPYPLDEKTEIPDEPPSEEAQESSEHPTETEAMLALVDGAELTEDGIVVGCPERGPEVQMLRAKCDGIGFDPCESRVGCPTWSAWDKRNPE